MTATDDLYKQPRDQVAPFEFNGAVADVFENMIERSVPGYRLLLEVISVITARYAQPGSHLVDLGCSLGASTLAIRASAPADCTIIGVDSSPAMLERCAANLARDNHPATCELRCEDMQATPIHDASMVVLNYTLQFIPAADRLALLTRICAGLRPGGVLLLAEKLHSEDNATNELLIDLHHDFKRSRGYSDLEISQKRAALEDVMVTDTAGVHQARLAGAGFSEVTQIFQALNFSAFLARK